PTTDENRDQRESTDDVDVNCAWLTVVKTADKAEINAGDAIGFTITVTNSGEGDAYDVVLTDVLPTQVTWTENTDACEIVNGTLTCEWDEIAAGASVEVKISGTTDADDCGVIANTAMVDASNLTDENRENEDDVESTDEVTVNCPYLKVVKTADDAEISAGDTIGFTITITNSGEGDAYDEVLTDVLPTQVTWTETIDACEIENGVLTCEWDKIEAGASVEIKISGTTDAADCGVIRNMATVDASNLTDENRANEDDLESTDEAVVNCSDLVIEKTAVDGEGAERTTPISPGDEVAFKISVANNGEGNAYDVVISDNLPVGIDWSIKSVVGSDESVNVDGCAIVDGVLTCEVGTLAPGASIDVIISGLTPDSLCAPVTNTASVSSSNTTDEEDPSDTATQAMDCNVDIQKVGPDGESPLAGACFTLNNSDVTYGPVCVDENGRARFELIPVGLYTLTESTVPAGYQQMKSVDIEVEYGDTMLVTAVNHRLPLVVKLDCLVDPGDLDLERLASDPTYAPDDCVRVEGVSFTTAINGQQIFRSYVTGPDGTVMVHATTGDKLVITEDIITATPGFLPRENPITIDPVTMDGSVAAFVNLAQDGNLRLLKVVCQSEEAQAPIFETLNGSLMRVPDGCWRGAGVAFTISGGHLTSPIEITTDRNGEAELSLRFGTYTLTEVSTGASYEVTVLANTTVHVRITNFEPEIPGIDPTPSPTPDPKTPIERLPDTGSGSASGSMLMLILPMLALLLMVAGAMLATNATRGRKR
ncbi:MAG: DUF11 domain-containing protein, partial [Thermomicrobiales bacterium]|nr:DUF11 domain-containing protein [Thermomicrobiales bacterium]